MAKPKNDQIVEAYIKIRDARSKLKKDFEDADKEYREKLDKLEGVLLKHLNDTGAESVRTEHGTFFKVEEIIPTASDWDRFYRWVRKYDAFEALEKRIKKTFVKEYMEGHDNTPPPGVSVIREYAVRIRRNDK